MIKKIDVAINAAKAEGEKGIKKDAINPKNPASSANNADKTKTCITLFALLFAAPAGAINIAYTKIAPTAFIMITVATDIVAKSK